MNDSEIGNSTVNSTYPSHYMKFKIFISVTYGLIITASLLGNTVVCLVILGARSLRQSTDTCFVLSLAVSELLTTCLYTAFKLEWIILDGEWGHGEIMCNVTTTAYQLAAPTSILSLLALSVHRYLTLKYPFDRFKVSPLMTRRRALAITITLWVYSLLFALAPVLGWKVFPKSVINRCCYFNQPWIYSFLSTVINFLIPILAACFIHWRIYRLTKKSRNSLPRDDRPRKNHPVATNIASTVQENMKTTTTTTATPQSQELHLSPLPAGKRHKSIQAQNESSSATEAQQKRSLGISRAAKATFIIVFFFVFCWLPYSLLVTIGFFCRACFLEIPYKVLDILFMLCLLNSAINPIIYSFRTPRFKSAVKGMCGKRRKVRLSGKERNRNKCRVAQSTETPPDAVLSFDNAGVV